MSKLKKLISSMLTAIMVLSLSANIAVASVASDVKNTEYENEAKVLGALGIMVGDADTGAFRPKDAIKRAEAAKIAVALMALSDTANSLSGNHSYPDVDLKYWANGYINVAKTHGMVIGDDTGNFRPEDEINYSEMVTILVRALGYETQALSQGGYPTGYIKTGTNTGLTKGVSAASDKLISRGDVATMVKNALTIKMMEQTGFGSNIKYEITNKTILKDKLDVELIKGKVEAVGSSVIDGGSELGRNEIRIDSKNYPVHKADTRTILGFNSEAYYSNKLKKIIAVVPQEGKNDVLNISADSVASVKNSGSDKNIEYWKDREQSSKTSKANIENNAYILYNGKISDYNRLGIIDSGYFSMLDSNSNGKYDIVFINDTKNYVVDDIYTSSKKISDKYGNPTLLLDLEDENKTIILEKAHEYIDISDLKEWDVITFTISEDGNIIYGDVVRESIKGKISELGDDNVYIGDQKFSIASNYPHSLNIGDEGIFYLDSEGKIAAFDGKKEIDSSYAYLENIGLTSGMNKELQFELFTTEGKFVTLSAADKITVNSKKGLNAEEALSEIGKDSKFIRFEKNSDGKVNKILTAAVSDEINENIFTLNMTDEDATFRASSSKLTGDDMSVTIGEKTIIFYMPQDGSREDYAIGSKDIFSDGGKYSVKIFDVSENYIAGAVIISLSTAITDESSDAAIVEKVNLSKNENGDNIYKLYALQNGKKVSFNSKNENTFKKENGKLIKEGDIILMRTNSNGQIDAIKVLFDTDKENNESKNVISDKLTTIYGKVTKKFSDSINVQIGDGKSENYEITDVKVYVYDNELKNNRISLGDISDIERYEDNGGKVFMRIYKENVKEIVVIK